MREPYKLLDLFSGIGGFSLGLERTGGFKTVAFCEISEFPRKVLAARWPGVHVYDDVRKLTAETLSRDGIAVDVISGGFPCQDLSIAGKLAGIGGSRSGLWSEIVKLVCEIRPKFLIVENVANLLAGPTEQPGRWFGRVLGDLAECGYDAEWENIPASTLGAPHRRERVWLVAYPSEKRYAGQLLCWHGSQGFEAWEAGASLLPAYYDGMGDAPDNYTLRVCDGFSEGVDRLSALGNAVVPQIPELIGRAILAADSQS